MKNYESKVFRSNYENEQFSFRILYPNTAGHNMLECKHPKFVSHFKSDTLFVNQVDEARSFFNDYYPDFEICHLLNSIFFYDIDAEIQ